MATFVSYNTDDPQQPQSLVAANGTLTLGPVMTGVASKIAGSFWSDQAGSGTGALTVQQSFDGGNHWDIVQNLGTSDGTYTGGTGTVIDLDVVAPMVQLVFKNGASQAHVRAFIRIFGDSRG